jgi:DNA-binding NtrC family response regulator
MPPSLLIVDDEQDMLQLLRISLESELDCRVQTASSAEKALQLLDAGTFDLVLADIEMPGMNGLKLLESIKKDTPDLTVLMMTAFGHIEMAVEAMKRGAYDFITKPFELDFLVLRLEKALERSILIRENLRLQREVHEDSAFQNIVGESASMQRVYETIQMVAKTELTVLITEESGTGKDLTARAIHALSSRSKESFVAVNCPTVPENIRIIASTNQPLKEKIKKAEFREDFFYRLNVLPIHLPPLRELPEDIPLIANHLLVKHCRKLNKPCNRLTPTISTIF